MNNHFSASFDLNGQTSQSQALGRASDAPRLMQASSSNNTGPSSSYNNTPQVQPGDHALEFPTVHNRPPYLHQSQTSIEASQAFDANRVAGQRPNNLIGAYNSSSMLKAPSVAQSLYPPSFGQDFECVAAPGVDCYCQTCIPAVPNQGLLEPLSQIPQAPFPPSQPYAYDLGVERAETSFHRSATSSQNLSQPPSYPNYNQTGASQFGQSSYISMPVLHGNPTLSFGSSSTTFPSNPGQLGTSNFEQSFPSHLPDMRYYLPNQMGPQSRALPTRSQRRVSTAISASASASTHGLGDTIDPDWDLFLRVQALLNLEPENDGPISMQRKQELANFVKIPLPRLEYCLNARHGLLASLRDLTKMSAKYGVPASCVATWFIQLQPSQQSSRSPHDSAYQSNIAPAKGGIRPRKKRKIAASDENGSKRFQCTHIKDDGSYCLKETDNFADWKRHEETHWPQRRWECLIQGSNTRATCHFCSGHIDLIGQQPSTTHGQCLNRVFRSGHEFARKDKLIKHVKDIHECAANVDTWYLDRPSNWKRQCGFCGSRFTDWNTRCDHVGSHFTNGKRMIPDWKDPWVEEGEAADQPPGDDDEDDDNDGEGDDNDGTRRRNQFSTYGSAPQSDNNPKTMYKSSTERPDRSHQDTHRRREHSSQDCFQTPHSNAMGMDEDQFQRRSDPQLDKRDQDNPSCLAPIQDPNLQRNGTAFEFVRKLGYGAFGMVDEVLHPGTKTFFARKSIRIARHHSLPALAQAHREVTALRNLRHVHIIGVIASYTLGDQFSIIMSPVAEWNLSEYLRKDPSAPLKKASNLSKWIGCLTSAVSYMHDKSWQHLDIKPSNILIASGQVILSDFGGALLMDGYNSKTSLGSSCAVTPMYCAPELVARSSMPVIAGASDIYSLGCVFLEMATVIHRQSLTSFEKLRGISGGDASYHRDIGRSWDWVNQLWTIDEALGLNRQHGLRIIASMLSDDPRKRPTARCIEESFQLYHLSASHKVEKHVEDEKYIIITRTGTTDRFDPMEVARRWFSNCSTSHQSCSSSAKDFFPSRILNVGTDSRYIHLQSLNDPRSPYVALSHCWAEGNVLKTTVETLGKMATGIEISSLSRAFSDAVRITRALGLKYLWIDSLCILQDCVEDWISESSIMHKIYSHSSLTICMASDGNPNFVDHGLIANKAERDVSNSMCPTCTGGHREFQALCDDTPTTMLLDSPWSKRGWTLQERILSPRVLYYSSTRMAWECGGNRLTLDIVSQMRKNLKMLSINQMATSRKRCWGSPLTKPSQEFTKLWRDIVKEYSKRQLSVPQDKFPALAGVASEIAALSGQKYLAGLWSHDLIHSLLWCRDFATTPLPSPSQYRAPSWSWAAIDSPVTWSKALLGFSDDEEARVLSCKVTPQSEKSPFGRVVNGGSLKIQGSMQKVVVERTQSHNILDVDTRMAFAFAQWDCLEPLPYKRSRLDRGDVADELWCLRILDGAGLLLRGLKEGAPDTFQRVGVYRIHESRVENANLGETRRGEVRTVIII